MAECSRLAWRALLPTYRASCCRSTRQLSDPGLHITQGRSWLAAPKDRRKDVPEAFFLPKK